MSGVRRPAARDDARVLTSGTDAYRDDLLAEIEEDVRETRRLVGLITQHLGIETDPELSSGD